MTLRHGGDRLADLASETALNELTTATAALEILTAAHYTSASVQI